MDKCITFFPYSDPYNSLVISALDRRGTFLSHLDMQIDLHRVNTVLPELSIKELFLKLVEGFSAFVGFFGHIKENTWWYPKKKATAIVTGESLVRTDSKRIISLARLSYFSQAEPEYPFLMNELRPLVAPYLEERKNGVLIDYSSLPVDEYLKVSGEAVDALGNALSKKK